MGNEIESVVVEFGNGKGSSFHVPLGGITLTPIPEMLDMTLREIAVEFAKQRKIKHGEIEFFGIEISPKVASE